MRQIILITIFCLSSFTVSASELQEHFARLNTWQADFVQTLENKDNGLTTKSQGSLWLLRPNRFRLEYTQPYKQIYVADGSKLWFYDEDLEQVTVKPQGNLLDQTPAMILSQPRRLNETYTITHTSEENNTRYSLKPKGSESGFERIEIVFSDNRLIEMHMYDHFAQKTSLVFRNIQSNHTVSNDRFRFIPPNGVDVIGAE